MSLRDILNQKGIAGPVAPNKQPFVQNDADRVVPTTTEQRTLTFLFNQDGNLLNPNYSSVADTGPTSFANDEERIYEVRLERIYIGDPRQADGTVFSGAVPFVSFQFNGENGLPHPLGYGPGEKFPYLYIMSEDWRNEKPISFDDTILASDIEGRIKIGPDPTINLKYQGTVGMTWSFVCVELLVTYKHFQKTHHIGLQ